MIAVSHAQHQNSCLWEDTTVVASKNNGRRFGLIQDVVVLIYVEGYVYISIK